MKLCIFEGNWADEMDISGFKIMSDEEWTEYQKAFNKYDDTIYYCIGTNEEMEYENGPEVLNDIRTVVDISETEEKFLKTSFKLNRRFEFGFFPSIDLVEKDYDDEL